KRRRHHVWQQEKGLLYNCPLRGTPQRLSWSMRLHTLATAIAVYVASSHANTNALRSTSKFPLSSVLSTWDTAFVYRSSGKHCRSPQLSGQKRRSTELLTSGLNLHDYSNSANSTLPMVQHHHHIFTEEILPEEAAYASKQHAHLAMPPGVGFALDVDGVLCRGGEVIKGAPAAIRLLQQHNIPHIYLTNSGGHTEAAKAAQLSARLGVTVTPDQVQMSHTPLRFLPDEVKRQRVLVVGKANAAEILAGYGFTDVVTADEYHALHPELWPDAPPAVALSPAARRAGRRRPLQAAVVLTAPANWYRDLQLLVDALRSPDGRGWPGDFLCDCPAAHAAAGLLPGGARPGVPGAGVPGAAAGRRGLPGRAGAPVRGGHAGRGAAAGHGAGQAARRQLPVRGGAAGAAAGAGRGGGGRLVGGGRRGRPSDLRGRGQPHHGRARGERGRGGVALGAGPDGHVGAPR
ncbi:unnamed protein product, partial [Heterosigma akashiwo]